MTIDTSMRVVDLTLDDFDLAIRFSTTKKPPPNWTHLVVETMVPVCSPNLKDQFSVSDAELLARAPLVHVTSVSADWQHWFAASGLPVPASMAGGLRVDTVQMAQDAAVRGLGIALGRAPLVDDDIATGRLVPLFGKPIASDSSYWLVTSPSDFQKPEVTLFRQWLVSELGAGIPARKDGGAASLRQPKQAKKPARMVSKKTAVP